jgi:hypothetical protein
MRPADQRRRRSPRLTEPHRCPSRGVALSRSGQVPDRARRSELVLHPREARRSARLPSAPRRSAQRRSVPRSSAPRHASGRPRVVRRVAPRKRGNAQPIAGVALPRAIAGKCARGHPAGRRRRRDRTVGGARRSQHDHRRHWHGVGAGRGDRHRVRPMARAAFRPRRRRVQPHRAWRSNHRRVALALIAGKQQRSLGPDQPRAIRRCHRRGAWPRADRTRSRPRPSRSEPRGRSRSG